MTLAIKKASVPLAIAAVSWLFAGLSVAQPALPTADRPSGKLTTHRFKLGDYNRRVKLYTPTSIQKSRTARPLVLVIHGGASTDRGMLKLTKGRWNQLADQHGFHVAYPNAVDKLWDFGAGKTSNKLKNRVDDLAYFKRVIDYVSARRNIDANRVFATGISRGGQASYFLACKLPDRMRAVMPVAMGLPEHLRDECSAGPAVAIAIMNGTADPQVPYHGGQVTVFRQKRDVVMSADQTVSLWRKRNGCIGPPADTRTVDKPGDRTSVNVAEWSACSGEPVIFYRVNNGGHTWPSGVQYLSPRIVGETSQDIDAADEAWTFFSRF